MPVAYKRWVRLDSGYVDIRYRDDQFQFALTVSHGSFDIYDQRIATSTSRLALW